MTDFPWVPLYRELAGKLLSFEERQGELIGILRELRESGLKVIALDDKDEKGRTVPLAAIDPFSFFASFNRDITHEQCRQIIGELKQRFSLQSAVPETFG